jgi:hypothetical protein
MKELVRRRFPRFFSLARTIKDQLFIEARVLRQVGFRILVDRLAYRSGEWQEKLPLQRPRRISIAKAGVRCVHESVEWARRSGLPVAEGAHTAYLPPVTFQRSSFRDLALQYPSNAGLKLVKNPGSAEEAEYLHGRGHSYIQRRLTYSHRQLSLVAAALHLHGLGPRPYDLLELTDGNHLTTAYLVAHCDGRVPERKEWEHGIDRLRSLEASGFLKVTVPDGFNHSDFAFPDCCGNCLVENQSGQFQYLDFQNFLLTGYGKFLENVVLQAVAEVHFGDRSILRGGRYLYQSVPGVGIPAKRRIEIRGTIINSLLEEAGVSLTDRVVLDVGCNIGMMMTQFLSFGARWCHGWDMASVTPHTERVLLALGCTRFSLTGANLSMEHELEQDVPDFVRAALDGCVISYLAIRRHIGWVHALARLPWSFMIYEGHEAESGDVFDRHIEELRAIVACRVVAKRTYEDGDSTPRDIAIVVRSH